VARCLNCGAERSGETCAHCGLTVPAAELVLRKRLLNRTAFFLLGALAFIFASSQFPPLELDGVLIFIGVLFFLSLGLEMWIERRAQRHFEVEALKRIYFALVPVPWLLAVLLLMNGGFDRSEKVIWDAKVVGRFAMFGPLPGHRLVVNSWRVGHRVERVSVSRGDYDRFHLGDSVDISVSGGLVGIPWVTGVERPEVQVNP
jgi:hypothetical protein